MWWFRGDRRELGRKGEAVAARYLRRAGYTILERNVRAGRNEIDIIAREGDTVCFVEVRTRRSAEPVPPVDSVGATKQRHIVTAARNYAARHDSQDTYYRFDIVAIVFPEKGRPEITLYRDAFHSRHAIF